MTHDNIIETISNYYGISVHQLTSRPPASKRFTNKRGMAKRRCSDRIVHVRQVCIFFLYRSMTFPVAEIADIFSYADHSQVSKSHTRIIQIMQVDATLSKDLDAITSLLNEKYNGTEKSDAQLAAIQTYRLIDSLPDGEFKNNLHKSVLDFARKMTGWKLTGPMVQKQPQKKNLNTDISCHTKRTLTLLKILQKRMEFTPVF